MPPTSYQSGSQTNVGREEEEEEEEEEETGLNGKGHSQEGEWQDTSKYSFSLCSAAVFLTIYSTQSNGTPPGLLQEIYDSANGYIYNQFLSYLASLSTEIRMRLKKRMYPYQSGQNRTKRRAPSQSDLRVIEQKAFPRNVKRTLQNDPSPVVEGCMVRWPPLRNPVVIRIHNKKIPLSIHLQSWSDIRRLLLPSGHIETCHPTQRLAILKVQQMFKKHRWSP
jgi:hypothetical protein